MEILPTATAEITLLLGVALCAALAWYDLKHLILPDGLNGALAATALAHHGLSDWTWVSPGEAVLGAGLGAGALYGVGAVYGRLRGRAALGLGDVKFMAAAGLWIGVWQVPALIAIASIGTLAVIISLRVCGRFRSGVLTDRRIPFGPGLATALALLLLKSHTDRLWDRLWF